MLPDQSGQLHDQPVPGDYPAGPDSRLRGRGHAPHGLALQLEDRAAARKREFMNYLPFDGPPVV